jgi:hypothetical protein
VARRQVGTTWILDTLRACQICVTIDSEHLVVCS